MSQLIETLSQWVNPETMGSLLLQWGGRILAALIVFVIGRWVVSAIARGVVGALNRANVDQTLTKFLRSLVYMTLMVFIILTAVGVLGVPTANFLAILGAAGLAVGLALKDSLANFSSGVMLVFFRPFKVGDYVDAGGVGGTVDSISIFNTVIKTPDNRVITVPNSLIYGSTITNYSAEATRRIDLVFGVGYGDNIARAKEIIDGVLKSDARILAEPAPTIMLLELADSSVNIAVRPWVKSGDYWEVRGCVLEMVKRALEDEGLSIPFPQRDLHIVSQTASSS